MATSNARGMTLLEVLAVIGAMAVLLCVILPLRASVRGEDQRSTCGNNCGQIIKCCHLYSDASPNLGRFPVYVAAKDHNGETGDGHTQNGRLAVSQLYDAYIKDHTQYACPAKPTETSVLKRYVAPEPPHVADYTNYGYDPGHTPVHALAGVVGDFGERNPKNGNSKNHGDEGPGQNVAIGAGSVEWWEVALRSTKDAKDAPITDDIYGGNVDPQNFPEELETHIIK